MPATPVAALRTKSPPARATIELDDNGYSGTSDSTQSSTTEAKPYFAWATSPLEPNAHLVTDCFSSFNAAAAQIAVHSGIVGKKARAS
jgi:hypothetical protein